MASKSKKGVAENNTVATDDKALRFVNKYISNCKKYEIPVDPSIVITFLTSWSILKPASSFDEGAMLSLLDLLEDNDHVEKVDFHSLLIDRRNGVGNGNSNARALGLILKKNTLIKSLDLSYNRLDDVGIAELCEGISSNDSLTELNLASNHFGSVGAMKLQLALLKNNSIKKLDLSRNALGYQSINSLICACSSKDLTITTSGNYIYEEILNSVSHGVGFLASVVGAIVLLSAVSDDSKFTTYHFWACFLYSFSLMFLFLSSCLFHSFFMLPTHSRILQILDHCGIYMLIAGSYTPFLLISLHHSSSARILLCALWLAAFVGFIIDACADLNSKFVNRLELTIFIGMGASILLIWNELVASLSYPALYLVIAGGGVYLFGIIFFILGEIRPIYHTVWHLFVMLAACIHWFDIYFFVICTELGKSYTDYASHSMETLQHEFHKFVHHE